MKVKPKEVLLDLPVALLFDEPWEIASFAANINTILHGKVRLKAEDLGTLGGRYVGLFYLQRNNEFQLIHDEFRRLIEEEEIAQHDRSFVPSSSIPALPQDEEGDNVGPGDEDCGEPDYDGSAQMHLFCSGCNNEILHTKGLEHCVCGGDWINGKCESQTE